MKEGRHGWQPARVELYKRHLTIRDVAQQIDVPERHLRNALRGTTHPSEEVRTRLAEYLGLPVTDLFNESSLSKAFDPRMTGRPAVTR